MSSAYTLTESADAWSLQLDKCSVTQFQFDYAISLLVSEGNDGCFVVIESPFSFRDGGVTYNITPGTNLSAASPVLALFGRAVHTVTMSKRGTLNIHFADDAEITVEADANYEAWEVNSYLGLNSPDGWKIVCMPGGSLAVWILGDDEESNKRD